MTCPVPICSDESHRNTTFIASLVCEFYRKSSLLSSKTLTHSSLLADCWLICSFDAQYASVAVSHACSTPEQTASPHRLWAIDYHLLNVNFGFLIALPKGKRKLLFSTCLPFWMSLRGRQPLNCTAVGCVQSVPGQAQILAAGEFDSSPGACLGLS